MNWYEIIGYAASLFIAFSMLMKNVLKLRVYNSIGCFCFVIYGIFIHSWSVAGVNALIFVVNLVYLKKMFSNDGKFDYILSKRCSDSIIQSFLNQYEEDILSVFKSFDKANITNYDSYLIMNDLKLIGIFIYEQRGEVLNIEVDYVVPEYRNFQPAFLFYNSKCKDFAKLGVRMMSAKAENLNHEKYLSKIGFEKSDNNLFLMPI